MCLPLQKNSIKKHSREYNISRGKRQFFTSIINHISRVKIAKLAAKVAHQKGPQAAVKQRTLSIDHKLSNFFFYMDAIYLTLKICQRMLLNSYSRIALSVIGTLFFIWHAGEVDVIHTAYWSFVSIRFRPQKDYCFGNFWSSYT